MQMRSNNAETAVHDSHCRGDMAVRIRKVQARRWVGAISFPEVAILLASDGDRDLWPLPDPTPEVRNSRTSRHFAHAQSSLKNLIGSGFNLLC